MSNENELDDLFKDDLDLFMAREIMRVLAQHPEGMPTEDLYAQVEVACKEFELQQEGGVE